MIRNILQSQWEKVCDIFGYDEYNMFVWGTFYLTFSVYWMLSALFIITDLTGKPSWMLRYKIRDNVDYPVPLNKALKAIPIVLINQTFVGIPFLILGYHIDVWRKYDSGVTIPTFKKIFFEFICIVILEEVGLYYGHRLLHQPWFFKRFHKQHHTWKSPIAIIAIYCHPVEHIINNIFPAMLGPLILGSHLSTLWIWLVVLTFLAINGHSGFHLPYFPPPTFHDDHHLKCNRNFGGLSIMDRLHGTFYKSKTS